MKTSLKTILLVINVLKVTVLTLCFILCLRFAIQGQNNRPTLIQKMKGGLELGTGVGATSESHERYNGCRQLHQKMMFECAAGLTWRYDCLKIKWNCGLGNYHVYGGWLISYELGERRRIELALGRRRMHKYIDIEPFVFFNRGREAGLNHWDWYAKFWQIEAGYRFHRHWKVSAVCLPMKQVVQPYMSWQYGMLQLRLSFALEQNLTKQE